MWLSQKMNNQVATNADGEQDADAAKTANQTNAITPPPRTNQI